MKKPRPYHHGNLERALLDEATRFIAAEGVQALTLRELARRLGVSHAAPAHHFRDKSALLAAIGAEGFERLAAALLAFTSEVDAAERMRRQGLAYVDFALGYPAHFRVMFGGALRGVESPPRLREAADRAYQALQDSVAAVLGRASPKRLGQKVFLAWSIVHGAATLLLDGALPGEPLGEDAVKHLIDSVVNEAVTAVTAGR